MRAPRVAFLSLTHRYDDTRILHKEARTLAEAGFEVIHIAPFRGHEAPEQVRGVRIQLYRAPSGAAHRLRRAGWLWRAAWATQADCLHCNEVESWLIGLLVKLWRPRTRVVFDVHEHYPSRFAEPRFPRWLRFLGEPVIRFLFAALTPWTDHVIFAKRSVAADFPVRPGQASYVFNYAPLAMAVKSREEADHALREELGHQPVAVHLGGLSRERGWPVLLEALARMRHRELRVVAFGEVVDDPKAFEMRVRQLGLTERINLRPRISYDRLFDFLAASDVGLILYQPGILNHVYAFPMKLYDYMRAGIPAIGPRFAIEAAPVIDGERCGWLIDTSDAGELAEALDQVCDDPAAARAAGARGKAAVQREYNWEQQAMKLVAIYRHLTGFAPRASHTASPSGPLASTGSNRSEVGTSGSGP
jgi:glycosyltransferase involved in cell wall biosynthesis